MKIVITNVFGPLNRGDHELFSALLRFLEKFELDISAIARDPELCTHFFPSVRFHEQLGKRTKGIIFLQYLQRVFYLACCAAFPYFNFFSSFLPNLQKNALKALQQADLVIACPGGYLEDSRLSFYTLLTQLYVAVTLKKKLVLAPMSIGPVQGIFPKKVLRFVLAKADRIFVREPISHNFCRELKLKPILSNDLAFVDEQFSDKLLLQTKNKPKFIAATVINWNFPHAINKHAERLKYIESMVETLARLSKKTGLRVKLIVQVSADLPVIIKVHEALPGISEIAYGVDTPEAIKFLLKDCFCVFASRFHSAIFSFAVGCPVLALSYLPKTKGMLDLYGIGDLSRPIENFSPIEASDTLFFLGNNRHKFIERRDQLLNRLQEVGNPFFDYIKKCLS